MYCGIRKAIEPPDLRRALGTYPTGVAIATAAPDPWSPVGITINSFTSISLEPGLVGWFVDINAGSYGSFARCQWFTISILAASQASLARRFATRGAEKFHDIEAGDPRGPVIPGARASLRCQVYRRIPLGDHLMLVGEVQSVERSDGESLLFAEGQFGTTAGAGRALEVLQREVAGEVRAA